MNFKRIKDKLSFSKSSICNAESLLQEFSNISKKIQRRFDITDDELSVVFLAAYFDNTIDTLLVEVREFAPLFRKWEKIAKDNGCDNKQCAIVGQNKLVNSLKKLVKEINSLIMSKGIDNTVGQINTNISNSIENLVGIGLISKSDKKTKSLLMKLFKIHFVISVISHFYILKKSSILRKISTIIKDNDNLDSIISLSLNTINAQSSMIQGYTTDAYESIIKILYKIKENKQKIDSIADENFMILDKNFRDV